MFLALELLSLSLYLLTGFSFRRPASSEASMKYFLLGAFSSAFFLFGVAFAYGATGTTASRIAGRASAAPRARIAPSPRARRSPPGRPAAGGVLLFKVAAVPFHMWTPDAYQGAPTCVTAFMSAGTKVAAFAALLRVFTVAFHPVVADWRPVVAVIAGVTMLAGSLLAIAQSDVKRMLAYSSIAHAGFILVGRVVGKRRRHAGRDVLPGVLRGHDSRGVRRGHVGVGAGRAEPVPRPYRGLARRSPFLAVLLSVFLLSLAGIPPTAGFVAKVVVFSAAVRAGYWPLVLVAVLASVVAAFFYLRVIVLMYMQEPEEEGPVP